MHMQPAEFFEWSLYMFQSNLGPHVCMPFIKRVLLSKVRSLVIEPFLPMGPLPTQPEKLCGLLYIRTIDSIFVDHSYA